MNKPYQPGDYKTMTISEKIDFLHKVHIEEISLFDENGNCNDIFNDFHNVEDELLHNPEQFSLDDILHMMTILDDDCFELTMNLNLIKMIYWAAVKKGETGVQFFLKNLQQIPENGRSDGLYFPIQWIISDEDDIYCVFKNALKNQNNEIKTLILQTIEDGTDGFGMDVGDEQKDIDRKKEIIDICS